MNTINNNNINFTAKFNITEDLGSTALRRAGKQFERMTADVKETMYLWRDNGNYVFSLAEKTPEPVPTTQAVGKDVFGYLFMESDVEGIANFLKTTLKALQARLRHSNSFLDADIEAGYTYSQDKYIGDIIAHANSGYHDLQKAGECIHLEA